MINAEQLSRIADEVMDTKKLAAEHRPTVVRYTRTILAQVLIRCHRTDIPPLLEIILVDMTMELLRADKAVPGFDEKEVSSISRGDTSIHYRDQGQTLKNVDDFLKDYDGLLVKYKKPNIPRSRKGAKDE